MEVKSYKTTKTNIGEVDDKDVSTKFGTFMGLAGGILNGILKSIIDKIKIPTIQGITFEQTDMVIMDKYFRFDISPVIEKTQ